MFLRSLESQILHWVENNTGMCLSIYVWEKKQTYPCHIAEGPASADLRTVVKHRRTFVVRGCGLL